jgi:cytochrome c oxidase subunit 4
MTHPTVSLRLYLGIFAALILLTGLTVTVAFFDLGGGRLHTVNAAVAISIALAKALLVLLYFMHVRYSSRLIWIFVGAGGFWLLILFVFTLADFLSRGWVPLPLPWNP